MKRALLFNFLILAFASRASIAQFPGGASAVLQREEDVLALETRGLDGQAFDKALGSLSSICELAVARPDATNLALGEYEFWKMLDLAPAVSGFAQLAREMDKIPSAKLPPRLFTIWNYSRAVCAWRTGDVNRYRECIKNLGYVLDWTMIGPFDNERGGGFARADEPEKGFAADLTARGKERDVRWRDLPHDLPPFAQIPLGELMRPNQQVHAYLRTTFDLATGQNIKFYISSGEAVRFWVDGKLVLDRNLRREIAFDQDSILLQLSRGVHEILAKVCVQENEWKFSCRMADGGGSPILNLPFDARRVVAADAARSVMLMNDENADAITYFSQLAAIPAADAANATESKPASEPAVAKDKSRAAAAFRHGFLMKNRQGEDQGNPSWRASAGIAVGADPDSAAYRVFYADSLRQQTRREEEKELNPFRREMEKAYALDNTNFSAALALADHYKRTLPIERNERMWLDRARKIAPANLQAILAFSDYLNRQNLESEAVRLEKDAAATDAGKLDCEINQKIGNYDFNQGLIQDGEARLRAAIAADRATAHGAIGILRQMLLSQGRVDDAHRLLDESLQFNPYSKTDHVEKARLHLAGRRKDDMLREFQAALAICPEDAGTHAKLAFSLSLLDDQAGATLALEQAVQLDPKDRTTRRYLEYLKSSVKPFEDEFRVDALEFLKSAPASVAASDEPYEVILNQLAYKLNNDGTTQRYEHLIATILNEEGAKRLDSYGFSHDSDEEQVRIRRARVIRKDGKVDDAPTSPGSAWVKFPPVAPGDTIDVEARIDTIKVGVFGNYFGTRHLFHGLGVAATRSSEQIYLAPPERELHFRQRNEAPQPAVSMSAADKLRIYRFKMTGLKKPPLESSMPGAVEFAPSVSVSTYGKWEEFVGWWWNLIEKECESSPAIKDRVAQLIQGKTTEMEKIRAIYDFVVTDVRYNAWEFGVHGYRPYQASTIFDRQYGDCKDKAILIRTMLADAGIKADPVLIHADETRDIEDMTLPMVNLFNHCIAYVPEKDGRPGIFLDGTATNHPMGILPDMDYGATVVVIDDGKPILKDVGYPDASFNRENMEISLEVAADGSAKGQLTLRPTGGIDVRLREFFSNEKGAQKENLERFLSPRLGRTKVNDLETSNLQNLGERVEIRASIEIEKLAKSKGNDYALPLTVTPRNLLERAPESKRNYDLLLGIPESSDLVIHYKLAGGLTVKSLPKSEKESSPFGAYSIETSQTGNEITIHATSSTATPRVKPDQYPSFRDFARKLDEAEAREIVLKQ
ncbi:MAG: DUF3857 domain-containing protein [Planctomycetes bacterium]|nr:DUF3857 domain-containing protein [Planctomycetota bacterium]